jgi:transposase-like protein
MAERDGTTVAAAVQAALIDDPDFLRGIIQAAVQAILEGEMTAHLGAEPYERGPARTGHRNGYKPRTLHTRVGPLELRVPQDRAGTVSTEVFARYQRSEQALVLGLMEMSLQGVATREVSAITEELCGTSFSESQVSALASRLDADPAAWRERRLTVADPYLSVDARYEHVRVDGRGVSQGVLIVAGVRADGRREVLAVEVADTERAATYQDLFRGRKGRGLHGVVLVTGDDHAGWRAAIARHCQGASWQRCQGHFARDLQGLVGRQHRGRLAADLRAVFAAPDATQARSPARGAAERWRRSHPAVTTQLEEGIEDCLACYDVPAAHRIRVRTTNGLERLNQELKRRTRVVRIFPNRAALLRLVTALAQEQSAEWVSGRRYLDMEALWEQPPRPPAATAHAA